MDEWLDPQTRMPYGGSGGGWWVFPAALGALTVVLIVVAAVVQGTGQDSSRDFARLGYAGAPVTQTTTGGG
jgi:hypothetical protein